MLGTDMRERNHHSDDSGANYNMLLCSGFPTKKFQRGSSPCISERQFTYVSYIAKEGEVGISINTVNHLLQLFDYLHWIYSHEIIPSFPYCMLKHQRFCLCFNSRQFSLCCFQVISLLFLFFSESLSTGNALLVLLGNVLQIACICMRLG